MFNSSELKPYYHFHFVFVTGHRLRGPRASTSLVWGLGKAAERGLSVILHINSWLASYLCVKMVILHINNKLAREIGVALTLDRTGRQLLGYSACARAWR